MLAALPPIWKVVAFTVNLMLGLVLSQVIALVLDSHTYHVWVQVVQGITMWCLSFIMINVGYEFTIDKSALADYGWDYLIAMTAAGFPWVFVGVWYILFFPDAMAFDEALLVARFAAPTSAGILFSMLEGAGLKDSWVFQKARILAIFDDLDTIVLMIPLKVVMVGFKWELTVIVGVIVVLLLLAWYKLHALRLPCAWYFTLLYAAVITAVCKLTYHVTHNYIEMEAIHMEVLLPAFVAGCVIDTPSARTELKVQQRMTLQRKSTRELKRASTKGGDLGALNTHADGTQSAPVPVPPVEVEPTLVAAVVRGHTHDPKETTLKSPKPAWAIDSEAQARPRSSSPTEKRCASKDSVRSSGSTRYGLPRAVSKDSRAVSKDSRGSSPSAGSGRTSTRMVLPAWSGLPGGLVPRPEDPDDPHDTAEEEGEEGESEWEHVILTSISMVFMVLVGLSMPALMGDNAGNGNGDLGPRTIVLHTLMVTVLMILGKMFPVFCYRDETGFRNRLALCLGMCPRGEVGASIIVIALELDVAGPALIISMMALAGNLVLSGGFIAAVKALAQSSETSSGIPTHVIEVDGKPWDPS